MRSIRKLAVKYAVVGVVFVVAMTRMGGTSVEAPSASAPESAPAVVQLPDNVELTGVAKCVAAVAVAAAVFIGVLNPDAEPHIEPPAPPSVTCVEE